VAIVIVNWNKKSYVCDLLNNINNIDYKHFDTIVIDNSSTDNSVNEIRNKFPEVKLIENESNLGGTGGFNTGIKYALKQNKYKYIWLLDNDVQIEPDTLDKLIKVMENDESIGLAGSRIVNSKNRDLTVEAGGNINWHNLSINTLFQNTENEKIHGSIENVDYVAICSALIRTEILDIIGLMDERYFIFFDDMDLGIKVKKNGYRVVSVLSSVVYHHSFTENRSTLMDFYYGYRNCLLFGSKYLNRFNRIFVFYFFLRYKLKVLLFLGFNGRKDIMRMGIESILDFSRNKWGKKDNLYIEKKEPNINLDKNLNARNILFLNGGNYEEILDCKNKIEEIYPKCTITLIISDDRLDLFQNYFKNITCFNFDKQNSTIYVGIIIAKLFFKNYDLAINFKYPSPFSFAVCKSYRYDYSDNRFKQDHNNSKNLWKLISSTIVSEITAIIFLPIIYFCSLRYKIKDNS